MSDSSDDPTRLPMSNFLHTIPEGSSSDVVATSNFNPEAIANTASPPESATSHWMLSMKSYQRNSQNASVPASPASLASSTRAVEAGAAGLEEKSGLGRSTRGSTTAQAGAGSSLVAAAAGESTTATTPNTPIKRRKSSLIRADKRKVGMVCGLAVLLVFCVIVVLVVIVKKLDKEEDNAGGTPNATTAPPNGTDSSINGTTAPTLLPTIAESLYDDFIKADDIVLDDDATAPGEPLLVQLDEAIVMLYTAEDPQLNMLPHVSEELFSNPMSPRYQAREWLLNNDTLLQSTFIDPETLPASQTATQPLQPLERIAQRYIMLVFYFSTVETYNPQLAPEQFTQNTNNNNEQNRQREQQDKEEQETKFMIHPDIHECYWVQNACGQEEDTATATTTTTSTTITAATTTPLDTEYIQYLNVSHANLFGTLPFEFGYLAGLRELAIHGNQLTGSVPFMLTKLPYLYVLDLSQNTLQGTIPPALWALPSLRFAYLHRNQFTGTIPAQLPATPSTELTNLWLAFNKLSGSLPEWFAQLPQLDSLSLRNNTWTGRLPTQWAQANSLAFLDVSYSQLTGTIPPSLLYGIPALQHLYLDYNRLTGTLPMMIGEGEEDAATVSVARAPLQMQALWLQYNQFTGTVPHGFAWEWNGLKELELHGNQFTGVWECIENEATTEDVWPFLEELAVDCSPATSWLEPEQMVTTTTATTTSGGVDMTLCKSCCIVCF